MASAAIVGTWTLVSLYGESLEGDVGMKAMKMSKIESGMRVTLAFYEAINRHDIAGIMSLMSADPVVESNEPPPHGTIFRGREEVADFWQRFFTEKPQVAVDLEEVFGLGKRCVGRWSCTWTAATGERVHVRGADIFRVSDGAIQEILSYVKGQS